MLVTWSKGHVWEFLILCHHLVYYGVDTSSASGDTYFICHVTEQDHSVEMSCVFIGESSLPHVATLKSLVAIGILIVKRKNASSKKFYKYVLTLKKWFILRRSAHKCFFKNHIFPLMTTFYNFTLKMGTKKGSKAHFVNVKCQCYCVCLAYFLSDKIKIKTCNVKKKILNAQNLQ